MNCPLCTETLDGGELVMVCTPCHRSLSGGIASTLAVHATGEFRVPTTTELAAHAEPSPGRPTTASVCAWCGKLEHEVRKLLGRGTAALCNECVALAADIMDAELGSWR